MKPSHVREFTFRSAVVAILVAAIIGGSYPYIVMKLGFGPNISVVSAFFGYIALGICFKGYNRWENNIVQTAGTSAGSTAFLCVLMAAFDLLRMDPKLGFHTSLTPMQSFWWLTTSGVLGVFLAIPMRQHFVIDEKLRFPDGIATAETLVVLDSQSKEAKKSGIAMGVTTLLSAFLMVIREDARVLANVWYRIPEMTAIGINGAKMAFGINWSVLSLGSGMLVGMRINISMLIGAIFAWWYLPPALLHHGVIDALVRKKVLLWVMWPATGMLISAGLTALLMRWKVLIRTFKNFSTASLESGDMPFRWVVGGSVVSAIALIVVQKTVLGMSVFMTILAILFSIPLMLVGLRVLGETNWAPISALSNMMQAVFGVIAPGNIAANMVASGVTGSVATQSEGLMQDYKTGDLIGSTPRYMVYAQLLAIPVGAGAVSYVYPLLRDTYGIGGDNGLQSPISQKWAGFAQLLSQGLSALPAGAVQALIVGSLLGVVFTILESSRFKKWIPSPSGLGIGMLVPAEAVITMFLGGLVDWTWNKIDRKSWQIYLAPVASGFIAGEAIVAVLLPILVALAILKLQP